MNAKQIALDAVMCALLIGGQVALSFVAGIEIVTLLLVCYSFVFGRVHGVLTAVSFSLLRCVIWGFFPTAILLYLIYYPLLALLFGWLGKHANLLKKGSLLACMHVVVIALTVFCILAVCLEWLPNNRLLRPTLIALFLVLACLLVGSTVALDLVILFKPARRGQWITLGNLVILATLCTVSFSMLDNVITPLFFGYDWEATIAYILMSFTAMLPQCICTVVSLGTLFYPVTHLFGKLKQST